MKLSKHILKISNIILDILIINCLCLGGTYSIYALWDNNQVYSSAKDLQKDLLHLKPEAADEASFEELLAINEDVCAWITLDHTNIDHPVLQGETNETYLNMDVYGEFALAGSIFLDSFCSRDFTDAYSLLYGHHMEEGQMFGDLDLYKEEDFFLDNNTGTLLLPTSAYDLEIFSCLVVPSSEKSIFDVYKWQEDTDGLLQFSKEHSLHYREDVVDALINSEEEPQILALSTCSDEFTDARTIILAVMKPSDSK